MEEKVNLTDSAEYSVNIEDVDFHLLVDREREKKRAEMPCVLHDHVSAELFAALKGTVRVATESNTLCLESGDLAVIPPGVKHSLLPCLDSEAAVISFICNKRYDRNPSDIYKKLSGYVAGDRIAICRGVPDYCERVRAISKTAVNDDGVIPAMKALTLLLELTSFSEKGFTSVDERQGERYDIHRMMQLDNMIGRYYVYDLKLSDVAEKLYISSRQLDRIVRKRYGKSLHKVIMEKRVQAAVNMLVSTDMTVERVGSTVGFSSNAGFYREFFSVYGVTPAEYRKNSKNSCKP